MRAFLLLVAWAWAWTAQASCIPPPNTWDFEASRWQDQISTNGGTLSALSYRTGTYFMQQVKWWGIRPQLGRVGLYLGGETNAILVPIIRDWWSTTDSIDDLISFVAADYSEATGLTGNTTTKYLRPNSANGINLSAVTTVNDFHMATYVRTATNESTYTMGIAYGGANATVGLPVSYANNSYLEISSVANQISVADVTGTGFYVATKVATNSRALYKNGSSILTSVATDSAALTSGAPVVHAFNSAGVITAWNSRTLSYYAYGKAISVNLASPYNIAVQNVQQALGRKMP